MNPKGAPWVCRRPLPPYPHHALRSAFCAESAHQKDDKAYQQYQANPAAADRGTPEIEAAAAEQ